MSAISTRGRMHFLPSYSPEPNPDELANADPTSCADTSVADTSATSSTSEHNEFLINMAGGHRTIFVCPHTNR
jgi:hypothetical protein